MSLLDLHVELTEKEYALKDQLLEMEFAMDSIEKNIEGQELDPLLLESDIQSSYQKLWSLQAEYDQIAKELEVVRARLRDLETIVTDITKADL